MKSETYTKQAKWQGLSVDIKILSPRGCLPLPRGYIHVEKHEKICIKSELKEIFFKLATIGESDKAFLLASNFWPQGVVCPCAGAIHKWKNIKKCTGHSRYVDFAYLILPLMSKWFFIPNIFSLYF